MTSPELVTVAAAVTCSVLEAEPTINAPTEVVEPEVGKVIASAKVWLENGVKESVPAVRMFIGRLPAAFANLLTSKEMPPEANPPAPMFVSPDPAVLKIAPLLPRRVIRPVVAETVALLMSNEYVAAPVPEEFPSK